MRIFNLISFFFFLIISIFGTGYFNPEYKSAFEADQQCHFDMKTFNLDISKLGCDHDLETRQWILFQEVTGESIAIVLERYRY